jgi:FkbM family methyltransferase
VGCSLVAADIYRLLNKKWFFDQEIQLVIDVGANEGQFIRTSLALMPQTPIFAFEPNPDSLQKLHDAKWGKDLVEIFPFALGSKSEMLPLNISHFSPASSLLKSSKTQLAEFSYTFTDKVVDVKVERLDVIINPTQERILLKIDVQGFELEVLKGATNLFDRVSVVLCEANLTDLYDKQCEFEEITSFLYQNGFQLIDIGQPIRSNANEEILYVDLAFVRTLKNILV